MSDRNPRYDSIAPIDYRYWCDDLSPYLTERAFTGYKLRVELALVDTLALFGMCPNSVATEVRRACDDVTVEEVYAEERRIGHDIRALVNCIQKRVSDKAKPFVHMTLTSQDVTDTANAARMKDAVRCLYIPQVKRLMRALIVIARREAGTVQVGRTHGQHGVPITFGFAIAGFISRLGQAAVFVEEQLEHMCGKCAGAVGSYNASSLFLEEPRVFEETLLESLGLKASPVSTQLVQPEYVTHLMHGLVTCSGIMAALADDMRHLQRTEIGEVGEAMGKDQVGSSTMPHKRNPISFENVKSVWKVLMPRMMTVYMDQLSEHQRDLTNSASGRTQVECIAYAYYMAQRLAVAMERVVVDQANIEKNLMLTQGLILAEPLYIILASLGHPEAHEVVRVLSRRSQAEQVPIQELLARDVVLASYRARMSPQQLAVLSDPRSYVGKASQIAHSTADRWAQYAAAN